MLAVDITWSVCSSWISVFRYSTVLKSCPLQGCANLAKDSKDTPPVLAGHEEVSNTILTLWRKVEIAATAKVPVTRMQTFGTLSNGDRCKCGKNWETDISCFVTSTNKIGILIFLSQSPTQRTHQALKSWCQLHRHPPGENAANFKAIQLMHHSKTEILKRATQIDMDGHGKVECWSKLQFWMWQKTKVSQSGYARLIF